MYSSMHRAILSLFLKVLLHMRTKSEVDAPTRYRVTPI